MKKKSVVHWNDVDQLPPKNLKRIKTHPISNLNFWYKESTNPLNSDGLKDDDDSSVTYDYFSSPTFIKDTFKGKEYQKFVVNEMRIEEEWKVLIGDDIECYVGGEWYDLKFEVGKKVTIINCSCCDDGEDSWSFELNDFSSNEETLNSNEETLNSNEKNLNSKKYREKESTIKRIYITNEKRFIILEDDLIPVTSFVNSLDCINAPYIKNKVADINFDTVNIAMIVGIIVHSVMEEALLKRQFGFSFLINQTKEVISKNLIKIYLCGSNENDILNESLRLIKNIYSFEDFGFEIKETEKKMASFIYNIKGNPDAVGDDVVLEIKTGKTMRSKDKAQAIMYSLMLKENFGKNFVSYLFYAASKTLLKIEIKHNEVLSLINLRNKLATLNTIEDCNCPETECCKIVSKILDLPSTHFLKKQWEAIEDEENARKGDKLIGTKVISQKKNIIYVVSEDTCEDLNDLYIDLYNHEFVKFCKGIIESINKKKITIKLNEEIFFKKNTRIYISADNSDLFFKFMRYSLVNIAFKRYALKTGENGFWLPGEEEGLDDNIEVKEIDYSSYKKPEQNDSYSLSDDGFSDDASHESLDDADFGSDDWSDNKKDEKKKAANDQKTMLISLNTNKNNKKNCSLENKKNKCKNLIFEESTSQEKPNTFTLKKARLHAKSSFSSFKYFTSPPQENLKYSYSIPDCYQDEFLNLNDDQKSALFFSLNCENYRIIHGMPGTGKSTVISLLIKILLYYKKKVLLICYTNMALNNLIQKFGNINVYRAKRTPLNFKTSAEVYSFFSKIELVAGTCFSFTDPVYTNRFFDFCVIDEGSQQHLLLSLIPVSLASKFVIVGDHLQLSPLSKVSKELRISLFEYLITGKEHSKLRIQYRMGDEIMRLSNILFYDNQLIGQNNPSKVEFIDTAITDLEPFIRSLNDCTILCYFNSQVDYIRSLTKYTVETVDRFQGSEYDHVIIVFDPVNKCEVMESGERLNVAITRARKCLTLVGNKCKMNEIEILKKLLDLL